MKWIGVLLALLVLTLSVQPVCASLSASDTCCNAYTSDKDCPEQDTPPDKHKEDCNSGCNPFQVCACCAFSVVTPPHPILIPFTIASASGAEWSLVHVRLKEGAPFGIWQPPRFS